MLLHLIQPREPFGPPERQEELRQCWKMNEGLFDHYSTPTGRPTFTDLFRLCKPEMVNVIANADIYFDGMGIERLAMWDFGPRVCLALSRWNVKADGSAELWDNQDSQDAWVFYDHPTITADFKIGTPGCDNRLMYLLKTAGYRVVNPAKTIKAFHLHNIAWRAYEQVAHPSMIQRVPGPYAYQKPTEL